MTRGQRHRTLACQKIGSTSTCNPTLFCTGEAFRLAANKAVLLGVGVGGVPVPMLPLAVASLDKHTEPKLFSEKVGQIAVSQTS